MMPDVPHIVRFCGQWGEYRHVWVCPADIAYAREGWMPLTGRRIETVRIDTCVIPECPEITGIGWGQGSQTLVLRRDMPLEPEAIT